MRASLTARLLAVLAVCALLLAAMLFIFCSEDTPDRCGDGQPLNRYTQFCYGGVTYDKCGGNEFRPDTGFCDASTNTVLRLCGNSNYTSSTQFCDRDSIYTKCGGAIYDPSVQYCVGDMIDTLCGGKPYSPATGFCFVGIVYPKCGGSAYDPDSSFCNADVLYAKCGGNTYADATEFCLNDTVYTKCGGKTYAPATQFCDADVLYGKCGGNTYADATEFCLDNTVYTKCGGNTYAPATQFCDADVLYGKCGENTYADATQFCLNNTVYTKCGGKTYAPATQFCDANVLYGKCGGNTYAPATEFCNANVLYDKCGGKSYAPATEFCHSDNIVYTKCGGNSYAPATEFCRSNTVYAKCNGNDYEPTSHFCDATTTPNTVRPLCDGEPYTGVNRCAAYLLTFINEVAAASTSNEFSVGTPVEINANNNRLTDRRFTHWEVVGVTVDNLNDPIISFNMPENAVTVTAKYEQLYLVTVESNLDGATGGDRYYGKGDKVEISAGTLPPLSQGDVLAGGWTSSPEVSFANAGAPSTSFTMPENEVTVTAGFEIPCVLDSTCFRDKRDNKVYKKVKIGTQTWMAENLNYAGANGSVGVCYEYNTSNCDTYGRLYRWVEAMNIEQKYENTSWTGSDANHQGICPVGWHVPSSAEWDILTEFVGGHYTAYGSAGWWKYAGTTLKSRSGWYFDGGTDDFGFSALPGGVGYYPDNFDHVVNYGVWWSATQYDATEAWNRSMESNSNDVGLFRYSKDHAFSVRCVQND